MWKKKQDFIINHNNSMIYIRLQHIDNARWLLLNHRNHLREPVLAYISTQNPPEFSFFLSMLTIKLSWSCTWLLSLTSNTILAKYALLRPELDLGTCTGVVPVVEGQKWLKGKNEQFFPNIRHYAPKTVTRKNMTNLEKLKDIYVNNP